MVEALSQQNTTLAAALTSSAVELMARVADAPKEVQTEIAKALSQRGNADDALVALQVANVLDAQRALDVAKQLPGHEHEVAQEAALANLAALTQNVQVEVQEALDRGETVEQVKAKAVSSDNVTQAMVATEVQKRVEADQQQKVADNDADYRLEQGLAAPEQATVNPFAAALAGNDVAAQFQQAMNDYSQGASRPADPGQGQGRGGRGGIG